MTDAPDFEEFVAARYAALVRTAYLLVGNRPDAEDLVQTVLGRLVPAWARVQGDPERYVRKALVHESVTRWRRRRWREVGTSDVPDHRHPAPGVEDAVTRRVVLRRALGSLAPRQRAVVVLRFYDDLSVAETAAVLGCAPGTVKSQTSDALARLRELVPEFADELTEPADAVPDLLAGEC